MLKKLKVPHTLVLLYCMILLAYVLTLVLPAGQFQTAESHGHEVVVPGTYAVVEGTEALPLTELFTVIPRGLGDAQGIIFFVFLIGGALAALLLAFFTPGTLVSPNEPHLYAELQTKEQDYALLAHWAPDSQTFMLRRDSGEFPADSSLEIWLIPAPSAAPISVGLMQAETLTQIPVPDALVAQMQPGATVAISREPMGGSPTGAPTGPVLAVAQLAVRG